MKQETEVQLISEAQAGNGEAFTKLVEQYSHRIYRVAMSLTRHREDAEDVMQQAFLKAYARLDQFRGESRFYTWLVRITLNEGLMKLRNRGRNGAVSLEESIETGEGEFRPLQIVDWGENPEQRYSRRELQEILANALAKLPPMYRIVVLLRDVENFSTPETAEFLHLSIPAVKSRLLRGRLQLREHLNQHFARPSQVQAAAREQTFRSGSDARRTVVKVELGQGSRAAALGSI